MTFKKKEVALAMKNRGIKTTALVLSAGMAFSWAGTPVLAEKAAQENVEGGAGDNSLEGTLAFAQCDEYINVRSSAGTDGEVSGKVYNENAVTIVGQEDDWYEITSGNVTGYVKADYFATGEEAQEIAERVAYNVAKVHPEVLNVRSTPDEDSAVVDIAEQSEELEVVEWDGNWMKVALGGNAYGYVSAEYVDYKTYYAVGETLEEEQSRLAQEAAEAEAAAEQAEVQAQQTEPQHTEETQPETEWVEPESEWTEPETQWTEAESEWTEPETEWTEPESEWTEPETEWTEPETEWTEPETQWTEPETEWTEPETEWTEPETEWTEPETEWTEPETEYTEETESVGNSDLGQQIADFAVQFVGNPYVYGGTSLTDGADCSGFTQSVFANFGIGLSRTADSQSYGGTPVDMGSLLPGDLLFYSDGGYIGHVALYIGGGQIVHASTPETGIIISNYDYNTPVSASRYW
jgi:cell wall-associated NlpC family hydrolase